MKLGMECTSLSAKTVYTLSFLLSLTPNAFLLLLSIRIYQFQISNYILRAFSGNDLRCAFESTFGQHVEHVFAPLPCSMSCQQLPVFVQFCRRLEFVQLHWAALQTAGTCEVVQMCTCANVHVGQFCRTVLLQQALPVARATTDLTSTPLRFKFLILLIQVFFEVGKCEHVN